MKKVFAGKWTAWIESFSMHGSTVQVDFSADGRWLVAACSGGVRLFEIPVRMDERDDAEWLIGYDWFVGDPESDVFRAIQDKSH